MSRDMDVDARTEVTSSPTEAINSFGVKLSPEGRRMLDTVNKLHDTGAQVDIDLPQIAVVGNQSAGKSSLIEAILNGITLPRASGTCTRCPTEVRLKSSDQPWECRVSLRFITDSNGQKLGQVRLEQFGDTIYKKEDVEERIRRAQRAILNPHIDRQRFLENEIMDNIKTDAFSTNSIGLDISGRDVVDLSFVDLPGLIRTTSDGNTADIDLVQRMVESYIQKPSCIILLTVSCETDFMNQGALQLAKQFDVNGERTVGVLTKPDRIERGDEHEWLGFIRGENQRLTNNWFCVKQPGTSDLQKGITWEQARENENKFFATMSPWRDLDATYQKYLRTGNLVNRLSDILSNLISQRLPAIQAELSHMIQEVRESLRELPKEPTKDPQTEISSMIHVFAATISKHVEGVPNSRGLLQVIRPSQEKFRKAIRSTAPRFQPFEGTELVEGFVPDPDPPFIKHEEEAEGQLTNTELTDIISVDTVMERARDARTRELPGNHPYVVEESFISEITSRWSKPANTLCDEVYHATLKDATHLVLEHFGAFGQGHLERQVRLVIQEHLQKRHEAALRYIDWLVSLENHPFTSNTHYFCDYRDKFLGYYKGKRQEVKNPKLLHQALVDGVGPEIQAALTALAAIGLSVKTEDLSRLLPPDDMEPALNIMAEVRAYFQVAYKRFADMVPLAIDYELVRGLERDLLPNLFAGLRIHSEDGARICHDLAQESPQVAGRREELNKKLERLLSAIQELSKL